MTTQFISFSPKMHLQIFHKELIKILQDFKNNNFTSETEYTQLRPHGSNSPGAGFYSLPKIYKNNMPMCPIVSACGTVTYSIAKFITKFFKITVAVLHSLLKIVQISSRKLNISQ